MSNSSFKKCFVASSVAMAIYGASFTVKAAEEGLQQPVAESEIEVIQVSGIRASSQASINTKRFAASQVDGIAAEDIGKLPDVTIADSLQRITGVQITRTAGEGGVIAIRGLPQVGTTLNGETFLSATTIDSSGADYSNLPAQLFSGVDVYKSAEASRSVRGISGSIDLKTRKPFDMEEGYTFAVGTEATRGSISKETDPNLNGLFSYNGDKFGVLFAAVTSEANLATDYNGYHDGSSENGSINWVYNNHTWGGTSPVTTRHAVPQGFSAFKKSEQRNRDAFQFSFQGDLGNGFDLVFDAFHTDQQRFNNKRGFSHNNRWSGFNEYAIPAENGLTSDTFTDEDGNNWTGINAFDLASHRLQTFTQVHNSYEKSTNLNLALNYDNGGALTGQVRMTKAKATARSRNAYGEGDLLSIDHSTLETAQGQLTPAAYCSPEDRVVGENGGCLATFAPGGIQDVFTLSYSAAGEHPVFSGFDQVVNGGAGPRTVAEYMADINAYHAGNFSSEDNTDDQGTIDTFSTQWKYELDDHDFITSMEFGARRSERKVDHDSFVYTSTFGEGCEIAQWKAVDQYIEGDACQSIPSAGEVLVESYSAGGETYEAGTWRGYTLLPPTRLDQHTSVSYLTDFGPVSGIPGIWVIDPENFKDPRQFHLNTYGNVQRTENPGTTYDVKLTEQSYFTQVNFEYEALSGNIGVNIVETDLYVKQNEVGAGLPHSGLHVDIGDAVTERSYTDYLPSLNLAYGLAEDVILRGSYAKNMMSLDLSAWGAGKVVDRANNNDCNCLRVVGGTLDGNPNLQPWRSENLSLSAEWYAGQESMFFLAAFDIDIESFTKSGITYIDEPDSDGVKRGPWPFSTRVQGKGGSVTGFEIGGKLAFSDFSDISFLKKMGMDANYTYSNSKQERKDVFGNDLPFPGMSEDTYNFVLWYENSDLSARIAYNSVSPRLISQGGQYALAGQSLYQDTYTQVDLNVSYNISDDISVYLNGSNIFEEYQQTYLEFKSQKAFQNIYEARWTLGARAKF